jgi:DNA-binding transcriptional regulator YhcF (GntR family)
LARHPIERVRVMEDGRPIFLQVAELLETAIIDGTLAEEAQVPSTNELAAFHRINPATAAKGVNQLVDDGVLYKKRGIGMFVSTGARAKLRDRRREEFANQYVQPLLVEARKLGIEAEELKSMIDLREGER